MKKFAVFCALPKTDPARVSQAVVPQPTLDLKPALPLKLQGQLRYAFINGHYGTSTDFTFVANHLNLSFSEFNPRLINDYGQSDGKADAINNLNLAGFFCNLFDIVVVGDTNPDARFLLKRLDKDSDDHDHPGDCQIKRVIMLTTNRFDFDIKSRNGQKDLQMWFDLVHRLTTRKNPKLIWICNNPYEPNYVSRTMGRTLPYTLIRPLGKTSMPQSPIDESRKSKVVMYESFVSGYRQELLAAGIDVQFEPKLYGGPTKLKQYRAVIDLPYQTSTMKMYENLAEGVISLVPTPRYLIELVNKHKYGFWYIEDAVSAGADWQLNFEFYSKDLGEFYYTFDSIEDLKQILARPILDVKDVRRRSPVVLMRERERGLREWKKILFL